MRDRVNELYQRKIFTAPIQEECRRRIDWIVANSVGPKVVDLGCSQGITCLLLGERGFSVTGVDLDRDAIDWANKELEALPKHMAERIDFVESDLFDLQPEQYKADTVILSEFIEHFDDPERVILHALRILRTDGRVVVTTPFGYKPSDDHKSTFTLCTLLEKIPDNVEVIQAFVADSFIRMIGVKRTNGPQARPSPEELFGATEHGLFESQRILWSVIQLQGRNARDVAERLKQLEKQSAEVKAYSVGRLQACGVRLGTLQTQLAEAKALSERRLQAMQVRLEALQTQLRETERKLAKLRDERKGIRRSAEYRMSSALVGVCRLPKKIATRLRQTYRQRLAAPQAIVAKTGETVLITRSPDRSLHHIDEMIKDHQIKDRAGQLRLRRILSEHSYTHRADTIHGTLGFPTLGGAARLISVVCSTRRPSLLKHAISNVRRQSYRHIEVVFVLNAHAFDADEVAAQLRCFDKFKVIPAPSATCLGECLNLGLAATEGELFAKFDDDDWYGPGYLEDLVLAHEFSKAPIVGKESYYCYLEELDLTALRFSRREFRFTKLVHGSTILADRKATEAILFEEVAQGTDTRFLKAAQRQGIAIFSADRFNFVHHRRASLEDHTWKITTNEFFKNCDPLSEGLALDQVFV